VLAVCYNCIRVYTSSIFVQADRLQISRSIHAHAICTCRSHRGCPTILGGAIQSRVVGDRRGRYIVRSWDDDNGSDDEASRGPIRRPEIGRRFAFMGDPFDFATLAVPGGLVSDAGPAGLLRACFLSKEFPWNGVFPCLIEHSDILYQSGSTLLGLSLKFFVAQRIRDLLTRVHS
jgi:hypothetical protein